MTTDKIPVGLRHYLWKGLDLRRFEVLAIVPETEDEAVIVMRDIMKGSKRPWCVEYRGSGRYFESIEQMNEYCWKRWHFSASEAGYARC